MSMTKLKIINFHQESVYSQIEWKIANTEII